MRASKRCLYKQMITSITARKFEILENRMICENCNKSITVSNPTIGFHKCKTCKGLMDEKVCVVISK